jgi:dTDP-4-amino-4,6-dideoxygalactose transaminase
MLLLRSLKLKGYVLMPSFTFSASAHAVAWNGLKMRFADIDRGTFCLDPDDVKERIDSGCGCIFAVPLFGVSCDIKALQEIADDDKVPLIFDSAHAFGTKYEGRCVGGFGDAEVFSFSPAKLVTACEGGAVCTKRKEVADIIRSARNYGSAGDDCEHLGLNARMTELSAIVADAQIDDIERTISQRAGIEKRYRTILSKVPGISFQKVPSYCRPNRQTFAVLIDPKGFGLTRDELATALSNERIETRKYFTPIHRLSAYRKELPNKYDLPVTEEVSSRILVLPQHARMTTKDAGRVSKCITSIHESASKVRSAIKKQ